MAKKEARRIRLRAGKLSMAAELNDNPTAEAIWKALPMVGQAQVWGDEIYFPIDVHLKEQDAQRDVPSGMLAYWPPGHSFCIFFGQRPYSPVNVFGKLLGDPKEWGQIPNGTEVRIDQEKPSEK
jgi:hypothetical protein